MRLFFCARNCAIDNSARRAYGRTSSVRPIKKFKTAGPLQRTLGEFRWNSQKRAARWPQLDGCGIRLNAKENPYETNDSGISSVRGACWGGAGLGEHVAAILRRRQSE